MVFGLPLVRVIDYPSARMTERREKRRLRMRPGTASHLRFNNNIYIAGLKRGHQRADRMVNRSKLSEGEREREKARAKERRRGEIVLIFAFVCRHRLLLISSWFYYHLLLLLIKARLFFQSGLLATKL